MKFCLKLINQLDSRIRKMNERGVALFIVLTAMATLAIFLGEITYTAQINQKLAYDRLDQVKATALAKSGFRIALLRIRAYSEIKKQIKAATGSGANAAAISAQAPMDMIEKVWSEPITIPFTGDISSLPTSAQDALVKFRKDSSLEGKLYLSILSQSVKFNLNSYLPSFVSAAPAASASPSPGGGPPPAPTASPTGSPIVFNTDEARKQLTDQITQTFQHKFDENEKFRDQYRSVRFSDIADDIMVWNDLTYDSNRTNSTSTQYKKAPFYDISELHYLPTIDDEIYDLLAPAYSATVQSSINVNKILEPTLIALAPLMTADERKKFFEDRDQAGITTGTPAPGSPSSTSSSDANGPFKDPGEFFTYLKKSAAYNTDQKITDFKNALTQRGISIVVEESQFLVHIEATVQQTKRTLEAVVMIVPSNTPSTGTTPGTNPSPSPTPQSSNNPNSPTVERSNLKVLQMRFL